MLVRRLGRQDYSHVWHAMQAFTAARSTDTGNEIWLVEHNPVYTQGQAGKPEHLLMPGDIPVVQSDRGGQVTYHGPGQLVIYLLLSLRQIGLGVRGLVSAMENSVIEVLASYGIAATARADAPGVYVGQAKIAALGLRVKRGCSYHGLSFNLDLDLEPFQRINPCGHQGMPVTRLADLVDHYQREQVERQLLAALCRHTGQTAHNATDSLLPTV